MTDFDNLRLRAHDRAQRAAEAGLSLAELAAMPLDEYARLTGRPTPAEAAHAALRGPQTPDPGTDEPASTAATSAPAQAAPGAQPGIDYREAILAQALATNDPAEYARLRAELGIGQGTTSATGARSAQAGGHPLLNAGIQAPRRISQAFIDRDAERDRLAAIRAEQRDRYRPGIG